MFRNKWFAVPAISVCSSFSTLAQGRPTLLNPDFWAR